MIKIKITIDIDGDMCECKECRDILFDTLKSQYATGATSGEFDIDSFTKVRWRVN